MFSLMKLFEGIGRTKSVPPLARALYVYAARRVWRRFSTRRVDVAIAGVGAMSVEPWDYLETRLFFFGTWEPSMSAAMRRLGREGMAALDIGANIGYYTLLLARIAGPTGRVIAFEPVPLFRDRLAGNVAANHLTQVEILPYGVSDQAEKRVIVFNDANQGASFLGEESEDGIELRRIADMVDDATLARVRLIKIDVEGMEAKVLASVLPLLDRLPIDCAIFAELRVDDAIRALLDRYRTAGFVVFLLENDYSLRRYASGGPMPPERVVSLPDGQHDVLLARGEPAAMLSRP